MLRLMILLVVLLSVMIVSAQVEIVPNSRVVIDLQQGDDGLWYLWCIEGCDRMFETGHLNVRDFHVGFADRFDASTYVHVLMVRRVNPNARPFLP